MEPVYSNSIPDKDDAQKQRKNGKALNIQWFYEKFKFHL